MLTSCENLSMWASFLIIVVGIVLIFGKDIFCNLFHQKYHKHDKKQRYGAYIEMSCKKCKRNWLHDNYM